jgi:pyruvate kinase
MLADGAIELQVMAVRDEDIECLVVAGGRLGSRKGVNVPSGLSGLPILSERDLEDLRFGVAREVDYVGLSFVRTAADVRSARAHIAALGAETPIIAKIETASALRHFDEILALADGVMIARGDLSIETDYASVPMVQKRLIARANERACPAITATQMLFSMVSSPRPTRAEVADVANAILDGSSAVMLSEETAIGQDPARAVRVMAEIARETERQAPEGTALLAASQPESDAEALARSACELSARLDVDVIVTSTRTGETARLVAKHRPAQPILALTPDAAVYRRLALVRGVVPALVQDDAVADGDPVAAAREPARAHGLNGRRVVVAAHDRLWTGQL